MPAMLACCRVISLSDMHAIVKDKATSLQFLTLTFTQAGSEYSTVCSCSYSTPSVEATSVEEIPRLRKRTRLGTVKKLATSAKAPSVEATSLEARKQKGRGQNEEKPVISPSVEEKCARMCGVACRNVELTKNQALFDCCATS